MAEPDWSRCFEHTPGTPATDGLAQNALKCIVGWWKTTSPHE